MTGTFSRLDDIERRLNKIEEEINFETHEDSLFPELTKEYEDSLGVGDKKDLEKPQMIEYNIVVSKDSPENKILQRLFEQIIGNVPGIIYTVYKQD